MLAINQCQKQIDALLKSKPKLSPITDLFNSSSCRDLLLLYSVWDQFFIEHLDPNQELIRVDENSRVGDGIEPDGMVSNHSVDDAEDIKPDVDFLNSQMLNECDSGKTLREPLENEMKSHIVRKVQKACIRNKTDRTEGLSRDQQLESFNEPVCIKIEPGVAGVNELANCQAGFSNPNARKCEKAKKTCKRLGGTEQNVINAEADCETGINGKKDSSKKIESNGNSYAKSSKARKKGVKDDIICSKLGAKSSKIGKTVIHCEPVDDNEFENRSPKTTVPAATASGIKRPPRNWSSAFNNKAAKVPSEQPKGIGSREPIQLYCDLVDVKTEQNVTCETTGTGFLLSSSETSRNNVVISCSENIERRRTSPRNSCCKITTDTNSETDAAKEPVRKLSSLVNSTPPDPSCKVSYSESKSPGSERLTVEAFDSDNDGAGEV